VAIHRRVGYLPGEFTLYEHLTGAELLRYLGHLRGGVSWRQVEVLAARLECDLSQRIGSLSHGNRQKVGLIQAFMSGPDLLVLDEPTNGLDPLMQQVFYHLVEEARAAGATVFLSSHILPEVERVCDRVGIIRAGELVAVEDIDTLKGRAVRRVEVRFAGAVSPEDFAGVPGVQDPVVTDNVLRCTVAGEMDALVKKLAGFTVVSLVSHEPSLEDVFFTYYAGEPSDAA